MDPTSCVSSCRYIWNSCSLYYGMFVDHNEKNADFKGNILRFKWDSRCQLYKVASSRVGTAIPDQNNNTKTQWEFLLESADEFKLPLKCVLLQLPKTLY